ncbi:class F sortase [Kitasatospora paracochleata]|uniref:class F sortase n=2 Tax=Kitasatospora paracochleata TaxID=58354 RepID=UPI0027E033C8|nr:class F sortase [Kitasatospora paracochleata]
MVVAGLLAASSWSMASDANTPPPARPATDHTAARPTAMLASKPTPTPRAEPVRIRIPALSVNTPLVPLHLDATGTLPPPASDDRNLAGWYADGTTPGETGTAVIVGHLDTRQGTAAFYRLSTLTPGQTTIVQRGDGSTAIFSIDEVQNYPKSAFPTDHVYQPTGRPELRLITCAWPYDRAHGGYQDNTVVYAHLTGTTPSSTGAAGSVTNPR